MIGEIIEDLRKDLDIPVDSLKTVFEDWAIPLFRRGVIVSLSLKRWRGVGKIHDDEIGMDESDQEWLDFSKEYFKLGTKNLLPQEVLSRINNVDSKARRNLSSHSIQTAWGRFVPCTAFSEWDDENKKIKKEYFDVSRSIYNKYDTYVEKTINDYKKYCRKIWDDHKSDKIIRYKTFNEFENNIIGNLKSQIINADSFLGSFEYETYFYFIPLPSLVEKDALESLQHKSNKEIIEHELEMKKRIATESADYKIKQIEQFLSGTIGEIRNTIVDVIEEINDSLSKDKDGCVSQGKNRLKLLNMIKKIRMLNFYDDKDVEFQIDDLQINLEKDKEFRSESEVKQSLSKLREIASQDVSKFVVGRIKLLEI